MEMTVSRFEVVAMYKSKVIYGKFLVAVGSEIFRVRTAVLT